MAYDFRKLLRMDHIGRENHIAHLARMRCDVKLVDDWFPVTTPVMLALDPAEKELLHHWWEVWMSEKRPFRE